MNISKLYKILDNLTGNRKTNKLPDSFNDEVLGNMFLDFDRKIKFMVKNFGSEVTRVPSSMPAPHNKILSFHQVSVEEVRAIVHKANINYCDSDLLSISDITQYEKFGEILNIFTLIINCSLINNTFPVSEKLQVIKPIIKGKSDVQSKVHIDQYLI